jgi:regulation of enolase protein 1 (concanavalin A-like superfamily)
MKSPAMQASHVVAGLFAVALMLAANCSSVGDLAGSGSSSSNAKVACLIIDEQGLPVAGVLARMLPSSFNPAVSVPPDSSKAMSDANGMISFRIPRNSSHCLTILNPANGSCAIQAGIIAASLDDSLMLSPAMLRAPGSLLIPLQSGQYAAGGSFFISGTDIFIVLDNADISAGMIVLDSIPAGIIPTISYQPISATAMVISDSITIIPSDTAVAALGLPANWQSAGIGETPAGSAAFINNQFIIAGGGTDIWNTADGFHFVYQKIAGNGSITALLISHEDSAVFAKAGIMIRESLNSNARNIALFLELSCDVTCRSAAYMSHRISISDSTRVIANSADAPAPYWLRLSRNGNVVDGSISADGIVWQPVGSDTVSLADTLYYGMAVTSHSDSSMNLARFDNVVIP